MHVVCENNERYNCKNARWIKKTMECMWIRSQMIKTKKILVSIDRTSIEYRSRKAESFEHKNSQVRLVRINRAKNWKYFKIGSTYQKESKEESKKVKTFSLKIWIFQSVEKQIRSIETWNTRKFLNTWKFFAKSILKQILWYEMHVNDSKCFQKHFLFNQINFYQD